jgi:hypothetical protein
MNISQVEIEIGDNLFLRITDVTLTPGTPGKYSGDPYDCCQEEPTEIDWKSSYLVKYSKHNGRPVEIACELADGFAEQYYDNLVDQALEDVINERESGLIDKYESDLQDKIERCKL